MIARAYQKMLNLLFTTKRKTKSLMYEIAEDLAD